MVVGWYHSHPGFGCWLSGVDINTHHVRSIEKRIIFLPREIKKFKNQSFHLELISY